ncbi:MAG: retropepsin-like aspartic protease [Neptuniibacter sp.]
MQKFACVLILGCLVGLSPSESQARIYQYVDDSGKKVYVDRLSKVPPEYLDQLTTREELKDTLSTDELQSMELQADKKLFKLGLNQEKARIKDKLEQWITPYKFIHNSIILPVKVYYGARYKELSLVLDTGASSTVVHKSALSSLNPAFRPGEGARVADGSIVETNNISFDKVIIGPYESKNVMAMVIDFKGGSNTNQGLLGMDFLLYAKYKLDKVNQLIIWEPELYEEYKQRLLDIEEQELQLKNGVAAPEGLASEEAQQE